MSLLFSAAAGWRDRRTQCGLEAILCIQLYILQLFILHAHIARKCRRLPRSGRPCFSRRGSTCPSRGLSRRKTSEKKAALRVISVQPFCSSGSITSFCVQFASETGSGRCQFVSDYSAEALGNTRLDSIFLPAVNPGKHLGYHRPHLVLLDSHF